MEGHREKEHGLTRMSVTNIYVAGEGRPVNPPLHKLQGVQGEQVHSTVCVCGTSRVDTQRESGPIGMRGVPQCMRSVRKRGGTRA